MYEATISAVSPDALLTIFGPRDQHVRKIRDCLEVEVTHRDGEIRIAGANASVARATDAFERLRTLAEKQGSLAVEDVSQILANITGEELAGVSKPLDVFAAGRQIRASTPGQARYVTAIRGNDLVFAIGPSGSGKTYMAVAMATEALKHDEIRKIVLVRPAIEAGESLGFLPGDLQAKINPYLRPLLDALHEMMDYDQICRYTEQSVIEVIPLAYMRGRTLNDAFIILDEAQNTTVAQMKMFLTRMGRGSKIVVAGDPTQTDLPASTRSGLTDAIDRLKHIDGFSMVQLSKVDIVRHRLVQDIVHAYEEGTKLRRH